MGSIAGDFNCITQNADVTANPEAKTSPSLKRLISVFNLKDVHKCLGKPQQFTHFYKIRVMEQQGHQDWTDFIALEALRQ